MMSSEPAVLRVELSEKKADPSPVNPYLEWGAEHFTWPLLGVMVFFVLRSHVVKLLAVITTRVEKSEKLTVGKDGITVEAVARGREEVKERVALIAAESQQLAQGNFNSAQDLLQELGARYCGKLSDDKQIRTQEKAKLAREMGAIVVQAKLDRAQLVDANDEAKLVALAHASLLAPDSGDTALLLAAAVYAKTLHVRYAIAMAFARLLDEGLVQKGDLTRIEAVLVMMRQHADQSLRERLDQTAALLAVR